MFFRNQILSNLGRHIRKLIYYAGIALLLTVASCHPAKYVPSDKYLLNSTKIKIIDHSVSPEALNSYIKQKSNKKIFGFIRFHLGIYNMSNQEKDNWWNRSLRTIGEKPVIYDPYLTEKTLGQLRLYMENKGYYNAVIFDSVRYKKQKAFVTYMVDGKKPYTIRNIRYLIHDSLIRHLYFTDTINSIIKQGGLFDKDVTLQNERIRIEKLFRNNGLYDFTREYVFFDADTFIPGRQVDLTIQIKNPEIKTTGLEVGHKQYKVRRILVNDVPDITETVKDISPQDTIDAGKGIYLTDIKKLRLNPKSFVQFIYIQPGRLYSELNVDETYNHIASLNLFKLVDIKFSTVDNTSDTSKYIWLDCNIRLSPSSLQSYSVDLEGTNSSGNIGGAVNLGYQHINLFRNAEVLDLKFHGALEALTETSTSNLKKSEELGAEANIKFPKFLLPVKKDNIIKKYNPKTLLSISYNFQKRPDYIRTVATLGYGYTWKETKYKEHTFKPVELNYVNIPYYSPEFDSIISGTYLESSYRDHLITNMAYTFVYNNQNINKSRDFNYFKLNIETAGNLLSAFNNSFAKESDSTSSYYKVLGIRYSQYVRADIEYKFYNIINPVNTLVYRVFAGFAFPYGNAKATPYEKRYYSGGANGLRGWQLRSLGPGSYTDADSTSNKYPNSTGDIKLEANFEYRFKLFWKMEGAFFVDGGNIWAIRRDDNRQGALFQWDKFYKEIALDSGLGLRFDFSFFILRADMGFKLRDPSLPEGSRWIPGYRKYTSADYNFNLGIGYPF